MLLTINIFLLPNFSDKYPERKSPMIAARYLILAENYSGIEMYNVEMY